MIKVPIFFPLYLLTFAANVDITGVTSCYLTEYVVKKPFFTVQLCPFLLITSYPPVREDIQAIKPEEKGGRLIVAVLYVKVRSIAQRFAYFFFL